MVTCGYLTVLAFLFFQIEILPVIFNIFLNFFFLIYMCKDLNDASLGFGLSVSL